MQHRPTNWKAFAIAGMLLLLLTAFTYEPSVSAAGHSISKVTLNPPTPNLLVNSQKVTISFSYSTTQAGGVRIFARPFVGSSPAPGYAASGAGISPAGSGTGTQDFTITTGNVTVDRIRIQMLNADQTVVLYEAFLPVSYQFRAP